MAFDKLNDAPDKSGLEGGSITQVEKDPEEGIKNLMKLYPKTFTSTTIEDVKVATAGAKEAHTVNFNLGRGTHVTHQGLTFFCMVDSDRVYVTRNPETVKELEKAGNHTMKLDGAELGTPLANADMTEVTGRVPYLGAFLNSRENADTNANIERNSRVNFIDKEAQFLTDEAFEQKFGITKAKWDSLDKPNLKMTQLDNLTNI